MMSIGTSICAHKPQPCYLGRIVLYLNQFLLQGLSRLLHNYCRHYQDHRRQGGLSGLPFFVLRSLCLPLKDSADFLHQTFPARSVMERRVGYLYFAGFPIWEQFLSLKFYYPRGNGLYDQSPCRAVFRPVSRNEGKYHDLREGALVRNTCCCVSKAGGILSHSSRYQHRNNTHG